MLGNMNIFMAVLGI
ncbi:hypothetical protein, partial [Citrobacter freundii]